MIPKVLTIAGSDSGGGAGIQADLKTFTALRVYGMSIITSITAQNTKEVRGAYHITPYMVELQFKTVAEDIGIDAVKTGMLPNKEIIKTVSKLLKEYNIKNVVVDPVMISKSGYPLLEESAITSLIYELFPLALLITPNIPEAEKISGISIKNLDDMKKSAEKMVSIGAKQVLLKGGHLNSDDLVDLLYDGKDFYYFSSKRILTKNTHGTGCTLSSAITSYISKGFNIISAIKEAKNYLEGAIKNSFPLGKGEGPLNHFWKIL